MAKPKNHKLRRFIFGNLFVLTVVLVFFILHLPKLTQPPLDEHSWRQVDTAAVARNFAEESPNIFYPRVDMRMQYSGITGMEFPIYNYAIFIFNSVFGFAHWHGRLVSLVVSLFGLFFFYKLLQSKFSESVARVGLVTLAMLPLYFYYARNIQPDMLMVTASIIALYFTQRFCVTKLRRDLWIALSFLSLAMLVKIPAVFIVIPMLSLLGWRRLVAAFTPANLLFGALVVVAPSAAWYAWSAHLSAAFGLGQYYYGDLDLRQSLRLIKTSEYWRVMLFYSLPQHNSAAPAWLAAGFGFIYAAVRKYWLPLAWLAAVGLFLVIFANKSFYHNYYSLPLAPALAALLAVGFVWLWNIFKSENRLVPYLFALTYFASLVLVAKPKLQAAYAISNPEYARLESVMDKVSTRHDLIITTDGAEPRMLYFAHRKGWALAPDQANIQELESLHRLGAKFVVTDATTKLDGLRMVFHDDAFDIYSL